MYCPRCSTSNPDQAKYCRSCRTDLESVALVLSDQSNPTSSLENPSKDWIKKRSKGARNSVQGAILLGVSLMIAVALGLFSGINDWMVIWTIFFSWMAGWGVVLLSFGIGAMVESRMLRSSERPGGSLLEARFAIEHDSVVSPDVVTKPNLSSPVGVTENTTELLGNQHSPALRDHQETS